MLPAHGQLTERLHEFVTRRETLGAPEPALSLPKGLASETWVLTLMLGVRVLTSVLAAKIRLPLQFSDTLCLKPHDIRPHRRKPRATSAPTCADLLAKATPLRQRRRARRAWPRNRRSSAFAAQFTLADLPLAHFLNAAGSAL